MNSSTVRLANFCMRHLKAGQASLKDRSNRLQMIVFNFSLYYTLGLTSLACLVLLIAEEFKLILLLPLPALMIFLLLLYVTRRQWFLIARVGYLTTSLVSLFLGVALVGNELNLSLFCLNLALYPFLLFRPREWRWIAFFSSAAVILFELLEMDLLPIAGDHLTQETGSVLRLVFTLSSFVGILTPSVLLLWQANQQYRQALKRNRVQALDEKLAAVGRLAAGAAHEINNPLAIIRLTLESLEGMAGDKDSRSIKQRIQKGYDAIQRIHDILQKLLVSTIQGQDQPDPLYVNTIAQMITQRSKHYLQNRGIQLKVWVDLGEDAVIRCHGQHVMDAVDSLINNALEAMLGHKAPTLSLTLRSEDRFFQVKVEDCGPGVSEEISRSIFTPFFTTKKVGAGLGLSLYSARCIARQYGGDLTCDRGPGGRFCLSLPLQKLS